MASIASRSSSSSHSFHHGGFPRPAVTSTRPFDQYGGGRRRYTVPQSFGPPPVHGFVRPSMNPVGGGNPGFAIPPSSPMYRVPLGSAVVHGDGASQSPRPTGSHHSMEYGQGYPAASWVSPPPPPQGFQMPAAQPGQEKWLGPPPPMYAVQQSPGQSAPESFPTSPVYAQYSPQVAPPPSYGTSQQQYSHILAPPNQQLFVVANSHLVAPPAPSGQFTPSGQPSYQVGYVPPSEPVANQVPPQSQQAVSSAGAPPLQQYVVANQPIVMQPTAMNPSLVPGQYLRTATPSMVPQQFFMVPAQQYVVTPPAQSVVAPPPASQVYSVVANQSVPPPRPVIQPVMAGQRMPLQVAALPPNQFQPIAVHAVMPANQMQPMPVAGHLQVVPTNTLQVVSANQSPPAAANPLQSLATSQQAPPPQPVYCYMPGASIASPMGVVLGHNELRPPHLAASSLQHLPSAAAGVQVRQIQHILCV